MLLTLRRSQRVGDREQRLTVAPPSRAPSPRTRRAGARKPSTASPSKGAINSPPGLSRRSPPGARWHQLSRRSRASRVPLKAVVLTPLRSGACTDPIQPRMFFGSPVRYQLVEPAGIVNGAIETGIAIGDPAASGPFALPQWTGTLITPVTCTVTGLVFFCASLK